jgi:hypothetical protein
MKTFKGQIFYYRIYEIGSELDIARAFELLSSQSRPETFQLKKVHRSMVIEEAPLVMSLGESYYNFSDQVYSMHMYAKLWGFGTVSLTYKIEFPYEIPMEKFKEIARFLEIDPVIEKKTLETAGQILHDLKDAVKDPEIWNQFEDYMIYNLSPDLIHTDDFASIAEEPEIYQLILTETNTTLSHQTVAAIKSHVYQYSKKDIAILDWNSALLCSKEDSDDISDVIEFALCQLLGMRHYDDVLDKKLAGLYKSIQESQPGVFNTRYDKLAKEAALLYTEISEIIEKIENSMKVIGDFYYAKIFRAALERSRFKDWHQSVDKKLENLADVSLLFQNRIHEKRSVILEMIIVLLFLIEVVPPLWQSFSKWIFSN